MAASTSPLPTHNTSEAVSSLLSSQQVPSSSSDTEGVLEPAVVRSLHVLVQRPHQRFFLTPQRLTPSTTARDVMRVLREMRSQEISRIRALTLFRQALWKSVIEIATLSTFRYQEIEAQSSRQPLEVIVRSRIPSIELTAALHRPWVISGSTLFAEQYPSLFSSFSSSPSPQALLLGQELNKSAIFWILFAALLLSLGVGLVVGFAFSRADLAIAVTGGLTGIISVLTALLVWMLQ